LHQCADIRVIQLHPSATLEATWQDHGPVPDSNQTADGVTHGFEHTSHLAIAPFGNGDAVPAIGTLTTALLDRTELRQTVVKLDTLQQTLPLLLAQGAQNAHSVLTLQSEPGVHQPIRQLTGTGKQ
jgi:hypothetical protein